MMADLFQYQFFVNALVASVFTAISCGIIGTYIVSRRMVFIGGGITHASFGGIGIAYFMGLNPIFGAAVFAVMSALGIQIFTQKGKVRQDSSIAIWWSLGTAVGIIFIAITPGYAPNLIGFLFGSILTVLHADLWFMAGVSVLVLGVFVLFYKIIVTISFDEEFARARNLPVNFFNYFLISLSALAIVASIRVSGVILVLSLLTLPQATANLFTQTFRPIMVLSVLVGFVGMVSGLLLSFYTNMPSGASIILVLTAVFFIARMVVYARSRFR